MLCGLTHEKANFETNCASFDFDRKRALDKEYYYVLSKYSNKYNSRVEPVQLKEDLASLQQKPLPPNFIIRKSNLRPFLLSGVFMGLLALYLGFEVSKKINSNGLHIFMLTIGTAVTAIFTYRSIVYKRSNKAVIQIRKDGLQLQNGLFYSWADIQIFRLIKGSEQPISSLIVKPLFEREIIQEISFLEYSPKRIIHLIECYKNLS